MLLIPKGFLQQQVYKAIVHSVCIMDLLHWCCPWRVSLSTQGGPKKWGHYVWRLRSLHAHIFKMPKQISVIFGLLQCRYILNTSVDSIFRKFIIHVRAFWRCGHAKIWAFKRSGLTFFGPPCIRIWKIHRATMAFCKYDGWDRCTDTILIHIYFPYGCSKHYKCEQEMPK